MFDILKMASCLHISILIALFRIHTDYIYTNNSRMVTKQLNHPSSLPKTGSIVILKKYFLPSHLLTAHWCWWTWTGYDYSKTSAFPRDAGNNILQSPKLYWLHLGGISVNALFWFQWAVVIIESISVWWMYSTVVTGRILAVQMEKEKYVW